MEKELDLSLPEWVFLDGNSHLGNLLEGRDILQHIQSYTILELFMLDEDTIVSNPPVKVKEFNYTNVFGENEKHLIALHFSLADDNEIDRIMDEAIEFYRKFVDWEDQSLIIEETSKDNWPATKMGDAQIVFQ